MDERFTTEYQVFFTPLVTTDIYGEQIEVSNFINASGIKKIVRGIDSGDYTVGVYTYGDINIEGINKDGIFNDENDSRSIFPAGRDRCKVKIDFVQYDDNGDQTTTITYNGIINEEATRVEPLSDTVDFKVLSLDSVIRNTKVPAGRVSSGSTVKVAIQNILNQPKIESVLTIDEANINPDLNIQIDDGNVFDNLNTRDALNELLLLSNSVLLTDIDGNVTVSSRREGTDKSVLELFGPNDIFGRENIISMQKYNTGRHRLFTSVIVNGQERDNSGLGIDFGVRQKQFEFDSITSDVKAGEIASRLLNEFKAPKLEVEVEVPTYLVKEYELLDRVSLNYPLRLVPPKDKLLPVIGITKIGSTEEPLPFEYGSLRIDPRVAFKIISISEDVNRFVTILKLRQVGTELNDGVFNTPGNAIIGTAVIGEAVIPIDGDPCDTYNPSVAGAAKIGCTVLA